MLKPIENLQFFPKAHRYRYHDQWLQHSPTKALSWDMDPAVKQRIEATRAQWEPRGNTTHAAAEAVLLGQTVEDAGKWQPWVDAVKTQWLLCESEPVAVEYNVCDPIRSVGGRFDCLLKYEGKVILADVKSVSSDRAVAARKPATAQLGAYASMLLLHHHELTIDRVATVVIGPGDSKVIFGDTADAMDAWEESWGRYQAHLKLTELPF